MHELRPYHQMTFKSLLTIAESHKSDHVMFVDDSHITYLHPKRRNGGRIYVEEIDTLDDQVNNFINQYPEGIVIGNSLMDLILSEIEEAIQKAEYVKRIERLN